MPKLMLTLPSHSSKPGGGRKSPPNRAISNPMLGPAGVWLQMIQPDCLVHVMVGLAPSEIEQKSTSPPTLLSTEPNLPCTPVREASPAAPHLLPSPPLSKDKRLRQCSSCHTLKTPYWREAWHPSLLLCNACGLRYSKFRHYCVNCNYVPRKEDKGKAECPRCNQLLL